MIVYGHRGAQGESPENTIAGLRHGIARGVRHVECDLRLSRDKELVVIHDAGLKRTTGQGGRAIDHSVAELAALEARRSGPPWPSNVKIGVPSLDAFYAAGKKIIGWQLELKGGNRRYNADLTDALVDWLGDKREGLVITSSDTGLICAVKERCPDVATGYVATQSDPDAILRECACSFLIAQWTTLKNAAQVRRLQRRGIHISTWTVNDASVIRQLHRMKVDSVISDYPSMALPLIAALQR